MDNDTSSVRFYIDHPADWGALGRCVIIRGWCFLGHSESIRAIRLRAGDLIIDGVTGLPRPGVKAALPEAPDDNTGFEIRGTLPSGRINIIIEIQFNDGTWQELLRRTVEVRRQRLHTWLGGGSLSELIASRLSTKMIYSARPILAERYPSPAHYPRPKFSTVTPSYNQARFLPETMRSVLEQPGMACDYIVRDGGSTDGSVAVIRRFATGGERRKEMGERKTQNGSRGQKPVDGRR